ARSLGFDAVEIFPPGPDAIDTVELRKLLGDNGLAVAAVGTGAGWVKHKLTLTSPDPETHAKAMAFVESLIDFAAVFDAPVIIGSMQGRWADGTTRETALGYLSQSLLNLGLYAAKFNLPLLYEPINRYETNLINRLEDGVTLLKGLATTNVKLLADLYHMNIEEANVPAPIRWPRPKRPSIPSENTRPGRREDSRSPWARGYAEAYFAMIARAVRRPSTAAESMPRA